jgi:hypothetical protein
MSAPRAGTITPGPLKRLRLGSGDIGCETNRARYSASVMDGGGPAANTSPNGRTRVMADPGGGGLDVVYGT